MQMIKGCEHNDPTVRKTTALGLFGIKREQEAESRVASVEKKLEGAGAEFKRVYPVIKIDFHFHDLILIHKIPRPVFKTLSCSTEGTGKLKADVWLHFK